MRHRIVHLQRKYLLNPPEHGPRAGCVRNIERSARVRAKLRGRPGRALNAFVVRTVSPHLPTVRVDLDPQPQE